MNTIAIALSDERLLKLQKLANDLNVSIEELVLIGIENLLAQPESLSPYEETIEAYIQAYQTLGYEICNGDRDKIVK
ncbi:hypothetical protein QUB70_05545 [Microcoleus sp. A003_D6]